MASFDDAAKISIAFEGGYVNDLNDPGGETNFGISKNQYPHENIKNMTREKALLIYKQDYWDAYDLSSINDQDLANKIFDMSINMSPLSWITVLQMAICACGINIVIDGKIGTRSISAANSIAPVDWLLDRIRIERVRFYLGRVEANPSQLENLKGWIRRAIS